VNPRLPAVAPREAVRALKRCGWKLDLAKGTLNQIVGASGVDRDEFLRALK
jgi:hypothetical protein